MGSIQIRRFVGDLMQDGRRGAMGLMLIASAAEDLGQARERLRIAVLTRAYWHELILSSVSSDVSEKLQVPTDRLQASLDVFDGSGVGEAQMTFAVRTEDDARDGRDLGLHQQFFRGGAAVVIEMSCVGEDVESARRHFALEAKLAQAVAHQVAALAIFGAHRGKIIFV